jgi:hypothetical protein
VNLPCAATDESDESGRTGDETRASALWEVSETIWLSEVTVARRRVTSTGDHAVDLPSRRTKTLVASRNQPVSDLSGTNPVDSARAVFTRPGVKGTNRSRLPVASKTALQIAVAAGVMAAAGSPAPHGIGARAIRLPRSRTSRPRRGRGTLACAPLFVGTGKRPSLRAASRKGTLLCFAGRTTRGVGTNASSS